MADGKKKKKKYTVYTTPKGELHYAYLTKPDEEYSDKYKVNFVFEDTEEGLNPVYIRKEKQDFNLRELFEEKDKKGFELATTDPEQKKYWNKFVPFSVIHEEEDEEGNHTGRYYVTMKSKNKPTVIDENGKVVTSDTYMVGNGSIGRIQFTIAPMVYKGSMPPIAGTTLYLNKVKIDKFIPYESDGGFVDDEDDTDEPLPEEENENGEPVDTSDF